MKVNRYRAPDRMSPQPMGTGATKGRKDQSDTRVCLFCAAALILVLVLVLVVDGVLSMGERLASVHVLLGIVFYAAVVALLAVGVVLPVVEVMRRPVFGLYRLYETSGRSATRRCRGVVEALERNGTLTHVEAEEMLRKIASDQSRAADAVAALYAQKVVTQIDAETVRAARTAFFSTSLSQSPLVDAVTMLSINFDLVRSIVERCGFRPGNIQVLRLYIRVMASALVAGSLEEIDLESAFAGILGGDVTGKVSGVVLAGAAQGLVNSFLVFRVGYMTKSFLCKTEPPQDRNALRRESYRAGLDLMKASGFVTEVAETVRAKASHAANAVAETVKNAANTAGRAAYDGVVATASAVTGAVIDNPMIRAFKRGGPQGETHGTEDGA